MTRHFKKFNQKKKNVRKPEVDSKRIVGFTTLKNPIYGSKSNLIKPLTINSLAPFDLYDKKEEEYKKNELNIFKKYTNNLYKSLWDE
tara:strand:+ start:6833 stop:7093 length:261 start_codon:yes stop_codon:yes gene_type:complete